MFGFAEAFTGYLVVTYIVWPLFLLPSSIWNTRLGVNTASEVMTILSYGSAKGQNGVYGESPVDLVTLSYMQFGVIGVSGAIAVWLILGYHLLKWTERTITDEYMKLIIKIYILVQYFLNSILYGDPYHIVQSIFPLIAFILYVEFIQIMKTGKIRIRRYKK